MAPELSSTRLSLAALTLEPSPAPIKHFWGLHVSPCLKLTTSNTPWFWLGQIFDLEKEALDHLATFISMGGEMNLTEVTGDKTHNHSHHSKQTRDSRLIPWFVSFKNAIIRKFLDLKT